MEKQAVALKYEKYYVAPKIKAKGKGEIADIIIDTARKNGVNVIKDEKLADTLSIMDIGDSIPEELYGPVAEILIFLNKIDKGI